LAIKLRSNLFKKANRFFRIQPLTTMQANLGLHSDYRRVHPASQQFFYFLTYDFTTTDWTLLKW
jgi:hypothetical protein